MRRKGSTVGAFISYGGHVSSTIREKQNMHIMDFTCKQELEEKELKWFDYSRLVQ